MAGPIFVDRAQETTTTTGTGTYTLAGAVAGFQSFAAVGNGNTCYYAVTNGTDWEVGLGTYASSGTTLARTAILDSSNGGSAVSWSAGTKSIFVDAPALFFSGIGQFNASAFVPTPPQRTATVPFVTRGLLLKRELRLQTVPQRNRTATPDAVNRVVLVPLYPRIDMPLTWASKDPDELLDYSLNWSQALAGDTIVNSDWAISDSSLVENHSTNSSSSTVIWLEDGALNQTYTVTNTIETAAGRIFQQSVNIRILSN